MSADPLAVHAPGRADLNLYAYVSGRVLRDTDPLGLQQEQAAAMAAGRAAKASSAATSANAAATQSAGMMAAGRTNADAARPPSGDGLDDFLSPPGKFEGEDAYDAARRDEFINSPLNARERAAFDYLQSQGTAREQFMAFREEARAWIYDNMPGFDLGSNGAARSYPNEVERSKSAENVYYHWMGLAMDWQPTLGPREGANVAKKGEMTRMQTPEQLKGKAFDQYNAKLAEIALKHGISPGQLFESKQTGKANPHPEHFQLEMYRGEAVTRATEGKVMRGDPGYDKKPVVRLVSKDHSGD